MGGPSKSTTDEDDLKPTVVLFSRRWCFLLLLCGLQITLAFGYSSFGMVHNIYEAYYDVSSSEVDFLTITPFIGNAIICPVLVIFVSSRRLALRSSILIASISLVLAYACIVISTFDGRIFIVAIIGQFLNGVSDAILQSIISTFAVLWFPDNEVGTAIAANVGSVAIGHALGFLVPSVVLNSPSEYSPTGNGTQDVFFHATSTFMWLMYIPILVFVFIITIAFFVFMSDFPPKPPTMAQAAKMKEREMEYVDLKQGFILMLIESRKLFVDRTFVLSLLVFALIYRVGIVELIMMNEFVRTLSLNHTFNIKLDIVAGLLMASFSIGAATGAFVSGTFMNRFKLYISQTRVAAFFCIVATLAILLGFYYVKLVAIIVGQFFYGFSTRTAMTAIYEIITQHTYPVDELFVNAWLSSMTVCGVIFAEFGRLIYIHVGSIGVLIFQTSLYLLSFVMTLMIFPKYKRLEYENERNGHKETSRLLE